MGKTVIHHYKPVLSEGCHSGKKSQSFFFEHGIYLNCTMNYEEMQQNILENLVRKRTPAVSGAYSMPK